MNYKVRSGFMAFQFGKPTFCVGIERNALKTAGKYHCIVGKSAQEFDITYEEAMELVNKYGEEKILRVQRGKNVFIVPVAEFKKEVKDEGLSKNDGRIPLFH